MLTITAAAVALLGQIASVWGCAVAISIFATADASGAHLNPAMTLAFYLIRRDGTSFTTVMLYMGAQLIGGILAGLVNVIVHAPTIETFERAHGIVRGQPESVLSAAAFGQYFPNPSLVGADGGKRGTGTFQYAAEDVSALWALLVEAWGTGLLAFVVFALTHHRNTAAKDAAGGMAIPILIGSTVAVLIAVYAPLDQVCTAHSHSSPVDRSLRPICSSQHSAPRRGSIR